MTEKDLPYSILKVVSPYEGSAFVVAPGIAVSCVHVCVLDGQNPQLPHAVEFKYWARGSRHPVDIAGTYRPTLSDPDHDIAVIELRLPPGLEIPAAPLSHDDQPGEEVVGLGFPEKQSSIELVDGGIFDKFRLREIVFDDGAHTEVTLEVLQINTGGQGFRGHREVRGGMSGGPIFKGRTGSVVAVIEGKKPRNLNSPPDGYGIQLKHLKACCPSVNVRKATQPRKIQKVALWSLAQLTRRQRSKELTTYCRVLKESLSPLFLQGLDFSASDATAKSGLDLAQVYVDLNTTTRPPARENKRHGLAPADDRLLSALEAAIAHPRIVFLGDPGSGKSTFITHLALCLAGHGSDRRAPWLERLPGWPGKEVPVSVLLRDFARSVPEAPEKAEPGHLWDFIVNRLKSQNLASSSQALQDCLEQGKAIVCLDGLDEVPEAAQRTFVRDAVQAFAGRYPKCRFVVTCRRLAYQDPAWQLEDFRNFTLAPFSPEQIERFIKSWYQELERLGRVQAGEVDRKTEGLLKAVMRPALKELASNPLLLTVMAIVHTHEGELPEARALLYERAIEILLWKWDEGKGIGAPGLPGLRQLLAGVKRAETDLKIRLSQLAYDAHSQLPVADPQDTADIAESELCKVLSKLSSPESLDWAMQVINVIKLRAGLLLERASAVYVFPHRTFQEYLAGAHLSIQPDFATRAAGLAAGGARWREVIVLAVGRLVYVSQDTARPLMLVAELCPQRLEETEAAWRQAWLAGDVLLDMGLNRVQDTELGREVLGRVSGRLADLLRAGALSAVERAAAGNTLSKLGDPRFRCDAWHLPDEPLLGFVEIPQGTFLMGSDKTVDPEASDAEMPQHQLTLPGYYVGRYPVTVAQFRAFVEASGHQPTAKESMQGLANHPVCDVTWYEALKYCDWLTERLRSWQGTPEPLASLLRNGWRVTLPSEAEWEKAARGSDGRIYPWGSEPDPARSNYGDTGIHSTSAVGSFPAGASPYGLLDLAGNVWEWTRSLWGSSWDEPTFRYPYRFSDGRENLAAPADTLRVLRGGSFGVDHGGVRSPFRGWDGPLYRVWPIGFRVVVLPCL
jgi:formylglycine-generating enzyme required for sulfatase activity